MPAIDEIEAEISHLGHVISAAEDWAPSFYKDPATHQQIIKVETTLDKIMRAYFRDLFDQRLHFYINWGSYTSQVIQGYDVNVLLSDDAFEPESAILMSAVYDQMVTGVSAGALAAESLTRIPLGISSSDEFIQKAARDHVAELVKLTGDESVIRSTKDQIRQALLTGLQLGENQEKVMARIEPIIKNPVRADMIARTEAVNAYGLGTLSFGQETNATGKYWISSSLPCKRCQINIEAGVIALDADFPTGHKAPSCHPRDRCSMGLKHDYDAPITSPKLRHANLETIAQEDITGRPNAEINTAIEKTLKTKTPAAIRDAIRLALMLPVADMPAMLGSIVYNGKSVGEVFYKLGFNPVTKKVERVLIDPAKDPLAMTPEQIAAAIGITGR
jgi:hypothetical protein